VVVVDYLFLILGEFKYGGTKEVERRTVQKRDGPVNRER